MLTAANVTKSSNDVFDVLPVLQTTTRTIRSVRNYLVSLPDDFDLTAEAPPPTIPAPKPSPQVPGSPMRRPLPPARAKHHAVPFPSAPAPAPASTRQHEPFTRIRTAALEVLSTLRIIEESNRIPLSDDAYDSLSVGSGPGDVSMSDEFLLSVSRSHTPPGSGSSTITSSTATTDRALFSGDEDDNDSMTSASLSTPGGSRIMRRTASGSGSGPGSTTVVPVKGTGGVVHVWADEEDPFDLNAPQSPEKKDAWDQRLVLGGGWLYKQIPMSALVEQKAVVERYLDVVDEVLNATASQSLKWTTEASIIRRSYLAVRTARLCAAKSPLLPSNGNHRPRKIHSLPRRP